MTIKRLILISLLSFGISSCRGETSRLREIYSAEDKLVLEALPTNMREMKFAALRKEASLNLQEFDTAYYWPMMRGGVTAKLFGETLSPLEKFEAIFGDQLEVSDVDPDAADRRRSGGITKAYLQRISMDASLPWAGHCEGSSLAVQWFKPIHPVTYKSAEGMEITFYPHEIRALLALWLKGYRAGEGDFRISGNRVEPGFDLKTEDGRPTDKTIRDVNPGLFLIALGNFIGAAKKAIIADISPTDEILNFPIVGYKIVKSQLVSQDRVNQLKRYNANATQFIETSIQVTFIDNHRVIIPTNNTPKTFSKIYDVILELDQDGTIIGGEWTGKSQHDHPDFIYFDGRNENSLNETTAYGFLVASAIRKLLQDSVNGSTNEFHRLRMDSFKGHPDNELGFTEFENHPIVPKR